MSRSFPFSRLSLLSVLASHFSSFLPTFSFSSCFLLSALQSLITLVKENGETKEFEERKGGSKDDGFRETKGTKYTERGEGKSGKAGGDCWGDRKQKDERAKKEARAETKRTASIKADWGNLSSERPSPYESYWSLAPPEQLGRRA